MSRELSDMSDSARDLLVFGIAAAKANSRDEARYYLEWVLRTDADYDQQTDAWYWLSTITDDPTEKREYLENTLAIQPNHPEARRDLAVLEGRLEPGEIVDWRERDRPVAPEAQLGEQDLKRYTCPNCGGKMNFDLARSDLFCQFCGYRRSTHAQDNGTGEVAEQDWVAAIYTRRGHAWQLPTDRVLVCQGCGATVTLAGSRVAGECPFCGSAHVVTREQSEELIEPGGVVLFAFKEAQAREYARAYLEGRRFKPEDVDDLATFEAMRPIYLPFWTFDISGTVTYSGFIVEHEYGHVRSVPIEDTAQAFFDDLTVPATRSLRADVLSALKFDTSKPVPYSPDLLVEWPVEIYSVSLGDAAVLAHAQAHKLMDERIRLSLDPALTEVKDPVAKQIDLIIDSYKHMLLPVWMTRYTYKGRSYDLVVNGQSGQTYGDVPRSGVQKFLGDVFADE